MTHRFLKKISLTIIGLIITISGLNTFVFQDLTKADEPAKNNIVLTVSPAKLRLDLEADKKSDGSFKVINSGKSGFKIKIEAKPYSVLSQNYDKYDTVTEKSYNQISRWINFKQDQYYLEPNETKVIDFKVNVPKDIPDGGQYAIISVTALPEEKVGQKANLRFLSQINLLVYAKTNGQTKESGQLEKIVAPIIQSGSKINIDTFVKNDGNTDFDNNSSIIIKDLFGNTKFKHNSVYTILPNTTRKISFDPNQKAPALGLFKLEITNTFLGKKHNHKQYLLFLNPLMVVLIIVALLSLGVGSVYIIKKKKS